MQSVWRRFYVPSHTWLLKVTLSGCREMEWRDGRAGGDDRWCIEWAGLRARALPHYESGVSVASL